MPELNDLTSTDNILINENLQTLIEHIQTLNANVALCKQRLNAIKAALEAQTPILEAIRDK